ncbi:hypothetical protein [Streptomyces eurocidicus]|uniref:Uncharacterized protein n=1 Tax=Streptomyces eurocidicus TaxID=66423 RepID=A0A7W8BG64_STREU|nr:hypothetical protein [Streptomyces eurocidicus]MBB5121721.1 hypothetical protein [Streptomyces eurocidicus]MBF6052939.1 hypothetical protein [Streptomyces eurocidicus]
MTHTTPPAPLLTYACLTTPHEPHPSPPPVGELLLTRVQLVVSNPRPDPVRCGRITINLPVGSGGNDLTAPGVGITTIASPHTWSVVAVQENVLVAVPQHGTAVFPPSEHGRDDVPTASLTIELNGIKVSREEGIAWLVITESSGTADTEAERTSELPIGKVAPLAGRDSRARSGPGAAEEPAEQTPPVNLWASAEADTRPVTLVKSGTRVLLRREGPTAQHTLYSDEHPDGTPITFPHLTGGVTRDASFVVRTVAGGIERFDTLTVTVEDPTLPGLRVDTFDDAGGLTVPAGVTCTGAVTVTGRLDARQTCTVAGAVTATGSATTSSLAAGSITASKPGSKVSAASLTVHGALESKDTLTANRGIVRIFGTPVVTNGLTVNGVAATDGFFMGGGPTWSLTVDSSEIDPRDVGRNGSNTAVPVHKCQGYSGSTGDQNKEACFTFMPFGTRACRSPVQAVRAASGGPARPCFRGGGRGRPAREAGAGRGVPYWGSFAATYVSPPRCRPGVCPGRCSPRRRRPRRRQQGISCSGTCTWWRSSGPPRPFSGSIARNSDLPALLPPEQPGAPSADEAPPPPSDHRVRSDRSRGGFQLMGLDS